MKLMTAWWTVLAVYVAVNFAAVSLPFLPGLGTFFLFGMVLPLGMIIGWWVHLARRTPRPRQWWVLGVVSTLAYGSLGFGTLWFIGQIWASV